MRLFVGGIAKGRGVEVGGGGDCGKRVDGEGDAGGINNKIVLRYHSK